MYEFDTIILEGESGSYIAFVQYYLMPYSRRYARRVMKNVNEVIRTLGSASEKWQHYGQPLVSSLDGLSKA